MIERIADGRTDLVFDYLAQVTPRNPLTRAASRSCSGERITGTSRVRFLVSRGASLSALGANLDLNGAVFHGHWQLSEFLIEHGADVNHPMPETGRHPCTPPSARPITPLQPHSQGAPGQGADPNRTTKAGVETDSFMPDCGPRARRRSTALPRVWRRGSHPASLDAALSSTPGTRGNAAVVGKLVPAAAFDPACSVTATTRCEFEGAAYRRRQSPGETHAR